MLTEIRSEKDRYTQICTELEQELSTIESESKEYKTKLEHKTRELNSLQNQNSRLEQEADRLQKKLESFKSNDRELISLKSVEKGLRQDLEYVENKLKTVQQELQAAKDAEGVLLEEIQKVQLASVSMRSRSEDLEEELEILKRKAGNDRALVEKIQPEVERYGITIINLLIIFLNVLD
jgi:chromosome segregation ATPase